MQKGTLLHYLVGGSDPRLILTEMGGVEDLWMRNRWRRGMGVAYNYHLGNFLSATASYSIYNRSYSNVGFGLSVNLGPVEIYCLTTKVIPFETQIRRVNFLSVAASS